MRRIIPGDFIVTDLGGIVESRHARVTLARSAAKPAQALAIVETGAMDQFCLDDADLALMCTSHSSQERHISRARGMLSKAHACKEDLRCGGHPPLSDAVNRAWIKSDYSPSAVCSNCSEKHAGMIAAARALGTDVRDYKLSTHPIQMHVKRVVDDVCGLEESGSQWGLDGCNLPAPAFPLHHLARVYGRFAAAADTVQTSVETAPLRTHTLNRIFHAMARYPELVAGDGRFCTVLMNAFRGSLIGKLGADGCYGIGIRASDQTRRLGAEGAIGVAVKIEDGNIAILYAAIAEILRQLQIEEPEMRETLAEFHCPPIKNTVGVVTERVSHVFNVHAVGVGES
ncbi:hypothetical protein NUU61_009476 [Penicillium alfredii]|uniref:Asparaginase n=1 Tax=Penicillium alfredii TaxID=1506179 RepID=A0A9W9EN38_9EURO|nr:uncharacterized protein NUU61_009476 [Penicillium alfredii]KAJ5084897.1 hypothetical protein NUU61_009476 [Penicillium alfredii]